jgi:hypothetical protein
LAKSSDLSTLMFALQLLRKFTSRMVPVGPDELRKLRALALTPFEESLSGADLASAIVNRELTGLAESSAVLAGAVLASGVSD